MKKFVLAVLIVWLGLGVVSGQEATPEADEPIVTVGETGEPTASPEPQAGTQDRLSTGEILLNAGVAIGGLLAAFVTGTITGVGSVILLIRNLDANTKIAIERLATSLPPDTLGQVREIIRTLRDAVEVADELTDGVMPGG